MPNRIRFGTVAAASISAFRLVTVPSYEDRFLFSLDRACDVLNLKNVTFLLFTDYMNESVDESDIDAEAAAALSAYTLLADTGRLSLDSITPHQ